MEGVADLICLSHLRWGFVFQRPNHLMVRFARKGRTFFFEEPIFEDGLAAADAFLEEIEVAPALRVVVPHLPTGLEAREVESAQRRLLDAFVAAHAIRKPILWFYTPMALSFAGHIDARAVVYDCMDELTAFRGASADLRGQELELLRRADVVFTGGESLYEAKKTQHRNVHAFPSSVDVSHFAKAREAGAIDPPDQSPLPGPRLGYFGVVDERIDLELLARTADADPSWQIVVVGPVVKIDPDELPRRANIHYLGQKTYDELPAYVAGWDVALMPFALNEATRFISPTKTLEYMAAGKPIVSTAIRDVISPYGEQSLVRIGDHETFTSEIRAALLEPRGPRAAADAFLSTTSWDSTWQRMSEILDRTTSRIQRPSPTHTMSGSSLFEEGDVACSTI